MSKLSNTNNLDMLSHKNKQEILLYISEARIQIYSHYLIAYDAEEYRDSTKGEEIVELYKIYDESSNSETVKKEPAGNDTNSTTDEKDDSEKKQKMSGQKQKKMKLLFSSFTNSQHGEIANTVCEGMSQKIIYFNNPDLAFYINQSEKKIQIHNLQNKTVQLSFVVERMQTLITVQTLFRKKLCEIGFFKKYRAIKKLGKGATSDVHLVQRILDKKLFAAKIISIKKSSQKQFDFFINQAKLLRILKHRNIINLESVYIHKKQLIQVLEYLPCGTLFQMLKNNQFKSNSEKWKVLKDITEALQYLRQRRIVHRDLKLQNIMVRYNTNSRQFVLSDFGLACWMGTKSPMFERSGTPGYIAPEILNLAKGEVLLDHRCDIFSLGVIAHLLFLNEPLFHYKGCLKELINLNKKANFDLNTKFYAQLPMHELNFLVLTLEKDIENRPNAETLLRLINTLFDFSQKVSTQKRRRKISYESQNSGVEILVKKQTSLTKKLKLDLNSLKKLKKESTGRNQQENSPARNFAINAKKVVQNIWKSIRLSPNKKIQMKIKQNSIQKQKQLNDFLV